jgi:hypothetical protein
MMRALLALAALTFSVLPAFADGWRYNEGPTPLLPKGEILHMISNGAAVFMCSASKPLTFAVEISYDPHEIKQKYPPQTVTWLVDDTVGDTSRWARQGLDVLADHQTSEKIAARVRTAKSFVGIRTGKLTSLFDVGGLVGGLDRLAKVCA